MKKLAPKISVRDKILNTAVELFYTRGVNNVGIDEIIKCSGVAKMSLYNHFKSKNELVEAYLETVNAKRVSTVIEKINQLAPKPEDRLFAFFDILGEWFKSKEFRGCPCINTMAEISDVKDPIFKKCSSLKQGLLDYIQLLVKDAGVVDNKDISLQILLLIDGAIVRAIATGKADHAKLAKQACIILINQAKIKKSK